MDEQFEKVREAALRILDRRRRTRKDLETRLKEKGFDEEIVARVCAAGDVLCAYTPRALT